MKVGVVNYGMGNLASVVNALEFIGYTVDLIDAPEQVEKHSRLILPGVGAFGKAMNRLRSSALDKAIVNASEQSKTIIGICLGMQLLFSRSSEFGNHEGLNLIAGEVLPFSGETDLRVPHLGWNEARSPEGEFSEFSSDFYFVHSFYCVPTNESDVLFTTNYGFEFCSGAKFGDHIYGLQFHPEKSQQAGLRLLKRLLS